MNKKNTLLLILNLSFLIFNFYKAEAQWVTIPDANFSAWLTQTYPSCMNGNQMDTTCSGIVNATSVNVSNKSISNLSGIQYFNNLHTLYCNNNQLPNLDISANTALLYLYCDYNQLTNLNVSANLALSLLYCDGNQLTNLNLLANTALTSIDCNANQLTNLDVSANTALTNLICQNNQLTNLDVSVNTALVYLNCNVNHLTNLNVSANTALTSLSCLGNQLTNLDVSANTALTSLTCSDNQLTNLDVSANTALTNLSCATNQLTDLDLSANTALTHLSCQANQLNNLDLSANTFLTSLNCGYNQLTFISTVPNVMYQFSIKNNNISCLANLPQVSNILNSSISNNPLTCVPNQTPYSLGLPLCIDGDTANNSNSCQSVVNITGNVFTDMNSNCIYNNSDFNIQNIPVKLFDNQNNLKQLSYTVNGKYSFTTLQPDSFKVKIDVTNLHLQMACGQQNTKNAVLDSINQTIMNIDFPVVCDSVDIQVHSVVRSGWVFPGQVHSIHTNLSNNAIWNNINCNNNTISGMVSIQVSGPVTYVMPALGALIPQVNGNTFIYSIADFNSLTTSSFGLKLLTDTTAQAGNQICVHVTIVTTPTDADTTNNEYDFCYNVVNSYDPNMKEVYPTNVLLGYDDWFTYTIHFQNTGTAPAFNIRLRDTLDTQLDINTFEFLGASHTANTSLNGNILTVRFNNIMLPDSTSDYEGSMGYYQYRVKPLPNITNGSTIENTAYIYFDYNPAIVTNTTQNNFEMPVGNRIIEKNETISIYPNPSTGIFTIKSASTIKTIEVFNLIGESVLQQTNGKTINLNNQPQGIYFCKVNGNSVVKLIKE